MIADPESVVENRGSGFYKIFTRDGVFRAVELPARFADNLRAAAVDAVVASFQQQHDVFVFNYGGLLSFLFMVREYQLSGRCQLLHSV